MSGTEYTITETGAGTGDDYSAAWECVNQTSGASVADGTGTSGTFTLPATTGGKGISVLCTFTNTVLPDPILEITKTSTADADTRQGDTVTYTVTAENVGNNDYTAADPARVVDDLTDVLDDAVFNDDAAAEVGGTGVADPDYLEPRLTWTGPLASGETVTITYTVTLGAGGDGVVRNVAWEPSSGGPPGPTPDCDGPAATVPCDEVAYGFRGCPSARRPTPRRSTPPARW